MLACITLSSLLLLSSCNVDFVLFYIITCYTNSCLSHIYINTTKLLHITCILVATKHDTTEFRVYKTSWEKKSHIQSFAMLQQQQQTNKQTNVVGLKITSLCPSTYIVVEYPNWGHLMWGSRNKEYFVHNLVRRGMELVHNLFGDLFFSFFLFWHKSQKINAKYIKKQGRRCLLWVEVEPLGQTT